MVDSIKPALNHTFLPPNVKEHLDRNNIEGVVKVQAGRTHADNAWWLGLADEYSYVLGVIGWVDFTNPAAADWFAEAPQIDVDRVCALAEDREKLWAQVSGADFLSDAEKRAMLGLSPMEMSA